MTTAQDQQSRAEFEKAMRAEPNHWVTRDFYRDPLMADLYEDRGAQAAWSAWQAARALPQGMEPVAWAIFDSHGFYETRPTEAACISFCDHYNARDAKLGGGMAPYTYKALYTAPQVQAMLAQGVDAAPVRQLRHEAVQAAMNLIDAVRCVLNHPFSGAQRDAMERHADRLQSVLAATPQPPAAPAVIQQLTTEAAQERAPLFWVRLLRDGLYEGPVHANSVGGKMLRDEKPDEWHPLYLGEAGAAQERKPLSAGEAHGLLEAAGYWPNDSTRADFINGLRHGEKGPRHHGNMRWPADVADSAATSAHPSPDFDQPAQ